MSVKQITLDPWSVSMAAKRRCFRFWKAIFSFLFFLPSASIPLSSLLTWIIAVSPIVSQFPVSHPHLRLYPALLSSTTPPDYKYTPYTISDYFISLIKVWPVASHHTQDQFQTTQHGSNSCAGPTQAASPLCLLSATWLPHSSLNYSPLLKSTMFHVLTHTVSLIHTYFSLNIQPKGPPPASIAWPSPLPLVLMSPWCPEYHICTSRKALPYAALQFLTCIVSFKAEKCFVQLCVPITCPSAHK